MEIVKKNSREKETQDIKYKFGFEKKDPNKLIWTWDEKTKPHTHGKKMRSHFSTLWYSDTMPTKSECDR